MTSNATSDTRTPCPRCEQTEAYAAIDPSPDGPRFVLVCRYCGTRRPYPAPPVVDVDHADQGVDRVPCRVDDAGVCVSHAEPIYTPGLRRRVRSCRVCGCTDTNCAGCIERTGQPCAWVPGQDDLCTACVDA